MSPRPQNARLRALSLCIGLAFVGAPMIVAAQSASQPMASGSAKANAVPAADKAFAEKAAIGGMAEVAMGKLAQQKAASDQVKQFGARMVSDHSKANDELKQIAGTKSMTLPADLDTKHKSKLAKMEKLSGAAFDRAYMDDMLADHKHDVADFQKEASSGRDGDLKGFASKTLPTLQEHLKLAHDTHAAVQGGKAGAAKAASATH